LPTSWHNRDQYGNIIKNLIKTQYKTFQKVKDRKEKLKLSQNVAYLIQIENSLINDHYKKLESEYNLQPLEDIIARNTTLEKELSEAKHRLEYHPPDPKAQAEQYKFDKMTNKQKLEYQKKCELDFQRKHPKEPKFLTA